MAEPPVSATSPVRTAAAFAAVASTLVVGITLGSMAATAAWARGDHPYAGLDTFARAMTTIEAHYVEEVGPTDLVQAAIRGMTHSLDPHSLYLDAEGLHDLQERTEGRYHGIGVELRPDPVGARVVRVFADGPAALAGVAVGDLVAQVDGVTLAGWTLDEIAERLQGERGTPVELGLQRAGGEVVVTVVRDQVLAPSVAGELLGPGYGYVEIEHFRHRTAAELAQELERLAADSGGPLRGLVLDLRGNPGGLLEEAVAVVDLFIGDAAIVETRTRGGQVEERLRGKAEASDLDLPLVVLIDGGSASAAEIVAGALQDLGRATLLGAPSFGKGSVQQVYEFEDGSALKLTVARYHLPGGRTFDVGAGLQPDVAVPLRRSSAEHVAQLRSRLEGEPLSTEGRAAVQAALDELEASLESEGPAPEVPRGGTLEERLAVDPQLEAAWARMRAGG